MGNQTLPDQNQLPQAPIEVSTKISEYKFQLPEGYTDNVEFDKGIRFFSCTIPTAVRCMCVSSVLSFIGYLVFFFIMINSLQMAKEEGEISLWTGDLSKTVKLY